MGPDAVLEDTPDVSSSTGARSSIDPVERSGDQAPSRARHATGTSEASAVVLGVVAAGAAVYGVLLHLWLLVHLPIWGDEAIVGLMARSIDDGHFTAFYWGQHYGGLEPYLVALGLKVGGGGEPAMNATPAVLAALAAVAVGGIVVAAGREKLVAIAAGCAAWVWPFVVVWQSVREGGFREATLCCGLVAVLCCIRAQRLRAGGWTFLSLGIALGLGWWASPEIAYFVVPCLVLLWGWWRRVSPSLSTDRTSLAPDLPRTLGRWSSLALIAGGVIVGSVPWWYANAHTGFVSLQSSALPNNGGVTYGTKLSVFFHDMLPLQLGLRTVNGGGWIGGTTLGVTLYVLALVIIVGALACAAMLDVRDPVQRVPLSIGLGVVAYPFLYAAAPGTGYWIDGRYGIYFPALVVTLFATMPLQRHPFRRRTAKTMGPTGIAGAGSEPTLTRRSHVVAALALAGATCLTVVGAHDFGVPASASFFSGWRSGDAPMEQVLSAMRAHHIDDAYGDYWTAYDLDFLSGGRPVVSPNPLLDVSRSPALVATVAHSADPAWLFFAPAQTAAATAAFANGQPGPGPYTEQTFEALLRQQGIPYTVVPLGVLDAVVPARRLTAP